MHNAIEVQQTQPVQYQTSPSQPQYQQIVIHNYPQSPQVLVSYKKSKKILSEKLMNL